MSDFQDFMNSYIETLLWSSVDFDGENFDGYSTDDFSAETLKEIEESCQDFWENSSVQEAIDEDGQNPSMAGHDFALTRNGHGAGFWDGDWASYGDILTEECRIFGGMDIYLGDDGKLYC